MSPDHSKIAAVVLAAGGSTRFGEPKQLLPWRGKPLVAHAADVAWSAGLAPVVVVIGAHADAVMPALAGRPFTVVRNYRWQAGMSSSLHVGIAALPAEVEAAVFLPIDQPLISPGLLQDYTHQWRRSGKGIVVPRSREGRTGSPVLFARHHFPVLATLSGDVGGRAIFNRNTNDIAYLRMSDAAWMTDVDTRAAYEELVKRAGSDAPGVTYGEVQGIICDMDGVLWRGTSPLPGLQALFTLIRELDLGYVLVTNNSSRTPAQYVEKLAGMGIATTTDHVLNSAIAAARLAADRCPGGRTFAIGGPGLEDALRAHGLQFQDGLDTQQADVVVVGWDRQLTWQKLATATRLILDGATFIGTNPDLTYPLEDTLAPGNGAQTAALTAATGVAPIIAGKPARPLYAQAMHRMGTSPEATLVIGDRLDTDILGGIRLGMPTVLVLTGISQAEELAASPIAPAEVLDDLPSLVRHWRFGR